MSYLKPVVGTMFETGLAGSVKPSTPVASPAALTSGPSVAAPTKAEHDAVAADLAATRTTLNNLLAALRTAGFVSP